jgi:DNA-binding MarR family transcriptional regulator
MNIRKYCFCANVVKMQTINTNDNILARNIGQFRRAIVREFVFNILSTFVDFDYSLPQLATLLLLDEEGELTIKRLSEFLGRSISATSRLLDQLVERGMVSRREDEHDRRSKRIAITEQGRMLIATLERRRADAQLSVMEYYSTEEQVEINRAMDLLAEAGQRRRRSDHPESHIQE